MKPYMFLNLVFTFLFLGVFSSGCRLVDLDNQEMNNKLDAHQKELNRLNESVNEGNNRLASVDQSIQTIGSRFAQLVEIFERRNDDFDVMARNGVQLTEQALLILNSIQPEEITAVMTELQDLTESMSIFTNLIRNNEDQLQETLTHLGTMTAYLAKAVEVFQAVDPDVYDRAGWILDEITKSLGDLNEETIRKYGEVLRGYDESTLDLLVSLSDILQGLDKKEIEEAAKDVNRLREIGHQIRTTPEKMKNFLRSLYDRAKGNKDKPPLEAGEGEE